VNKSFWTERWQQQQIGFHQAEINKYLQKYWQTVNHEQEGSKVFVPLCGKSLDLLWLREQGHPVLGIEFSDLAVNDFFGENQLEAQRQLDDRFMRMSSDKIDMLCGDFFHLQAPDLTDCHLVYDRASLVALPESSRKRYASHMSEILPDSVRILLVTMEYPQQEMQGPPFSVPETEVFSLYEGYFQVEKLATYDIYQENPRFKARGLSSLLEKVYLLKRG
jgi:thiopurine S-methyltransferase